MWRYGERHALQGKVAKIEEVLPAIELLLEDILYLTDISDHRKVPDRGYPR